MTTKCKCRRQKPPCSIRKAWIARAVRQTRYQPKAPHTNAQQLEDAVKANAARQTRSEASQAAAAAAVAAATAAVRGDGLDDVFHEGLARVEKMSVRTRGSMDRHGTA